MEDILILSPSQEKLRAIKEGIHWEQCKIEHVYLCETVKAARDVVQNKGVFLAVVDIGNSGKEELDFAIQMRRKYTYNGVILLTDRPVYEDAKSAMRAGIRDLMEELDFADLEERIGNLVVLLSAEREYYYAQKEMPEKNYLREFVSFVKNTEEDFDADETESILKQFLLRFSSDDKYLIVCLSFPDERQNSVKKIQEVRRRCRLLVSGFSADFWMSEYAEKNTIAIASCHPDALGAIDEIRKGMAEYVMDVTFPVNIFLAGYVGMNQLIDALRKVLSRVERTVYYQNKVVFVGTGEEPDGGVSVNYLRWSEPLEVGDFQKMYNMICFDLQYLASSGSLDKKKMRELSRHFRSMMQRYINLHFDAANLLIRDPMADVLEEKSVESLNGFLEQVKFYISIVRDNVRSAMQSSLGEQAKKYIDLNFTGDISRKSVAEYVSVNENYLSQVFQKEIGVSISQYIKGKRLEMAKNLLTDTEFSISEIAGMTGFSTSAYFTSVFRKAMRQTPGEYRRANRKPG